MERWRYVRFILEGEGWSCQQVPDLGGCYGQLLEFGVVELGTSRAEMCGSVLFIP